MNGLQRCLKHRDVTNTEIRSYAIDMNQQRRFKPEEVEQNEFLSSITDNNCITKVSWAMIKC